MESEKTMKNIVFKQFDSGNDSDMDDQDEYQTETDVLLPISQDAQRLFINHDDGEISSNCDECDQVFTTTYDMIIHRRQDHKGESNNICGFASEHGKHRHK